MLGIERTNFSIKIKNWEIHVKDIPLYGGFELFEAIKSDNIDAMEKAFESEYSFGYNSKYSIFETFCDVNPKKGIIFSNPSREIFNTLEKQKQIIIKWSYKFLLFFAAANNNAKALLYLIYYDPLESFIRKNYKELLEAEYEPYYDCMVAYALDYALEFGNKKLASFLMEEGGELLYYKEPPSYRYKVTLHNVLNINNNLRLYAQYYSGLPGEIIDLIWSYKDENARENIKNLQSVRKDLLETRKASVIKCGATLLGLGLCLGLGIVFLAPETTVLYGLAGLMYLTYNTKLEKTGIQLFTSSLLFIARDIIIGETPWQARIIWCAATIGRSIGPAIISELTEKTPDMITLTDFVLPIGIPISIVCGLQPLLADNKNGWMQMQMLMLLCTSFTMLGMIDQYMDKVKPYLNFSIKPTKETFEIFMDTVSKTLGSAQSEVVKGLAR